MDTLTNASEMGALDGDPPSTQTDSCDISCEPEEEGKFIVDGGEVPPRPSTVGSHSRMLSYLDHVELCAKDYRNEFCA